MPSPFSRLNRLHIPRVYRATNISLYCPPSTLINCRHTRDMPPIWSYTLRNGFAYQVPSVVLISGIDVPVTSSMIHRQYRGDTILELPCTVVAWQTMTGHDMVCKHPPGHKVAYSIFYIFSSIVRFRESRLPMYQSVVTTSRLL